MQCFWDSPALNLLLLQLAVTHHLTGLFFIQAENLYVSPSSACFLCLIQLGAAFYFCLCFCVMMPFGHWSSIKLISRVDKSGMAGKIRLLDVIMMGDVEGLQEQQYPLSVVPVLIALVHNLHRMMGVTSQELTTP
jgi:hypothetical protein